MRRLRAGSCRHIPLFCAVIGLGFGRGGFAADQLPANTVAVNAQSMEISYAESSSDVPLRRVDLYVTEDGGRSWRLSGSDEDGRPPVRLDVHRDGLYGLYLVLANDFGSSSPPPAAGQTPLQWVLVDGSPPLTQIKRVRVLEGGAHAPGKLVISWAAYDPHLTARPISLYYQLGHQTDWKILATAVHNVGAYESVLPDDADGSLKVRLEARDLAGNIGSTVSTPVAVTAKTRTPRLAGKPVDQSAAPGDTSKTMPLLMPENHDPEGARRLYELGQFYRKRGDYAVAVERFIEALNLDPAMTAPRRALADIYLTKQNYQGALDLNHSILDIRPQDRVALRSSALAASGLNRYPEAMQFLDRALAAYPDDALAWIEAGDILLRMGSPEQAAAHWKKALKISQPDSQVGRQARKRLQQIRPLGKQ